MPEETTPLLPGDAPGSPTADPERVEDTPPVTAAPPPLNPREYFKRPLRLLTLCSLISTTVSLFALLAAYISIVNAPFMYYTWASRDIIGSLGGIMFCAFIIALINTRFTSFPMALNIIADFFISVFTFNIAANLFWLGWPSNDWCSSGRSGCEAWVVAVQVLIGVGAGFGIIVGVAHLLMFVLRVVAVFKSGFFSTQRGLVGRGFTPGEVTFQFTIKVLKQQDAAPAQVASNDAPSGSEGV